jgi:hypothetical protein
MIAHAPNRIRETLHVGRQPDWVIVVPPMPMADARRAFEKWKREHPGRAGPQDDDIRIDMYRTKPQDELRYLIRAEAFSRVVGER